MSIRDSIQEHVDAIKEITDTLDVKAEKILNQVSNLVKEIRKFAEEIKSNKEFCCHCHSESIASIIESIAEEIEQLCLTENTIK